MNREKLTSTGTHELQEEICTPKWLLLIRQVLQMFRKEYHFCTNPHQAILTWKSIINLISCGTQVRNTWNGGSGGGGGGACHHKVCSRMDI